MTTTPSQFDMWVEGICIYRCNICDKTYLGRIKFSSHLDTEHDMDILQYRMRYGEAGMVKVKTKCRICQKLVIHDRLYLMEHMASTHFGYDLKRYFRIYIKDEDVLKFWQKRKYEESEGAKEAVGETIKLQKKEASIENEELSESNPIVPRSHANEPVSQSQTTQKLGSEEVESVNTQEGTTERGSKHIKVDESAFEPVAKQNESEGSEEEEQDIEPDVGRGVKSKKTIEVSSKLKASIPVTDFIGTCVDSSKIPIEHRTASVANLCVFKCDLCNAEKNSWGSMKYHLKMMHAFKTCSFLPKYIVETRYHHCRQCANCVICDLNFIRGHAQSFHQVNLNEYRNPKKCHAKNSALSIEKSKKAKSKCKLSNNRKAQKVRRGRPPKKVQRGRAIASQVVSKETKKRKRTTLKVMQSLKDKILADAKQDAMESVAAIVVGKKPENYKKNFIETESRAKFESGSSDSSSR